MLDLGTTRSGQLGGETRFSDLFAAATISKFTGALLVRAPKDSVVFFRQGQPVNAAGPGFDRHFIGEVLVRSGAVMQSAVSNALAAQSQAGDQPPLLGALLIRDAKVDPDAIKRAVIAQTEARVLGLFAIAEATWQAAPGENARTREVGVPCPTEGLLIKGLLEHAADDELRSVGDALLGKAIILAGEVPDIGLDEVGQKIVHYLEKPRKPDQLERAVNNRRAVRATLRALLILDRIDLRPIAQAIPIPKATLLKGAVTFGSSATFDSGPPITQASTNDEEVVVVVPPPRPAPAAPTPPAFEKPKPSSSSHDRALLDEVRATHKTMTEKSYFDLLGVKEETPPDQLKKAFHTLAKKYHPDAFSKELTEDDARMIRELAAKVNEAFATLSNEKTRVEYMRMLADERIKGDSRRAERVRDAEVKHQMGLVMLKKRDYQKAREYFTYAHQADADHAEYKASLAWAMMADPKFDRKEAKEKAKNLLDQALQAPRPSANVHFYMAQLLKADDQMDEALLHFRRAVKLDPKHSEAAREARLLEMRKEKTKSSEDTKNPLSKLFKR
jgi:curved DNA-binding protein CbpA